MKKTILYTVIAIMAVLCGNVIWYRFFRTEEADFTAKGAIQEAEYRENDTLKEKFQVTSHYIPTEKNQDIKGICVYEDWVYYALDHERAFEDPEGNRVVPEFSDAYQTQIRAQNMETGEDKLLYKYDADRCIPIPWMECNGEDLIWADTYGSDEPGYRLCHMKLNEPDEIEIIFMPNKKPGTKWNMMPTMYEDNIFWYDLLNEEGSKGILYEYGLNTGKCRKIFENVCSAPYDIFIMDGIMTTYHYEGQYTSVLRIEDEKRVRKEIKVPDNICEAITNQKMCVWSRGYGYYNHGENIMTYDFSSGKAERIKIENFNYRLTENFLVVNATDAVYVYDVQNKEYTKLLEIDEEKGSFEYLFDEEDGSLCSFVWMNYETYPEGEYICVIRERE